MRKEMNRCEEEVVIAVKEKSNLQEDNRILLKTIDALNLLGFRKTDKVTGPLLGSRFRDFRCQECDFNGMSYRDLVTHRAIHTGENPFNCEVCGEAVANRGNLDNHVCNLEVTTLNCSHCDYTTGQKSVLQEHVKLCHSNVSLFECSSCSFTTPNQSVLHQHNSTAHKQKFYQCNVCWFTSQCQEDLTLHIEQTHSQFRTEQSMFPSSVRSNNSKKVHLNVDRSANNIQRKYCYFFNTSQCRNTAESCRFSHTKAPLCRFSDKCSHSMCPFSHENNNAYYPQEGKSTFKRQRKSTQLCFSHINKNKT